MTIEGFKQEDINKTAYWIQQVLCDEIAQNLSEEQIKNYCETYSAEGLAHISRFRRIYLECSNNQISGIIGLERNVIHGPLVSQEFVDKGIGTSLIKNVESTAIRNKWQYVEAIAWPHAKGFFEKLGYREIGRSGIEILMKKSFDC
ncbi:MAG: GNAT family N-acetyltransferase [Candidatus Pacearchaeota archaeon]|nr:GNAT family N-acetyltransferase [Candidatus Pacearchaeota archaeon]